MGHVLRSLREAAAFLVAAAVLCIGAGGMGVWLQHHHGLSLDRGEVAAAAGSLAAVLSADALSQEAMEAVVGRGYSQAWLLDGSGRLSAQAGGPVFHGVAWRSIVSANDVQRLSWEGRPYWVAAAAARGGGTVVLARPVRTPELSRLALAAGLGAFGAWLVLAVAGVLVVRGRRSLDPAVRALADRLAVAAPDGYDRQEAVSAHGEHVLPLFELADRLATLRAEADEARALARAFLQVGRHYTIICTLDGRILDANPAFLARSGLTQEQLRDVTVRPLAYFLPLGDLLGYAKRSLEENAVISGLTCPLTVPGDDRVVEVSLRAIPARQGTLVFLVLSDLTQSRRLEHQIDQFTDAMELMVDQRVAQITAGRATLEEILDDAGLPVIVFDRDGATERMNARAEHLLGRTQFTLPQFGLVAEALFPEPLLREVFTTWFWSADPDPLVLEVAGPKGRQPLAWVTGRDRRGGEVVRRALIGMVHTGPEHDADPVRRIEALVAGLDTAAFEPGSRAYVEVIREAVSRLERSGGDGASAEVSSNSV